MENATTVQEIKLVYHPSSKVYDSKEITSSKNAYNLLKNVFNDDTIALQEEFHAIFLNRQNKLLGTLKLSVGGTSSTVVDLKILFGAALKGCASGIILSHNHPSGNMHASEQDLSLTAKVKEACKLFDISLLDHLIIGLKDDYISLADLGQL